MQEVDGGFVVELERRTEVLAPLVEPNTDALAHAGACARYLDGDGFRTAFRAGDTCLIGVNYGEFGGGILSRPLVGGGSEPVDATNPLRFLDDREGGAIVVSGIAHLHAALGWVDRLRRTAEGHWVSDPLTDLYGYPVAFRATSRGLLLLIEGDDPGCQGNRNVLVEMRLDGRVTRVE